MNKHSWKWKTNSGFLLLRYLALEYVGCFQGFRDGEQPMRGDCSVGWLEGEDTECSHLHMRSKGPSRDGPESNRL